ncbi:MAG: hypothetical protein RL189_3274 [Pseudomonadota bacterium]
MVTTAPKNSRNKRLHIVFFTDASKTKSTSFSIRNLAIAGCLTLSFFTAAGVSLHLYRQNRSQLSAKDAYIRELKSAITSYAVTNEKNQLAMANESDPQTDLTRKIAVEIQSPSQGEVKVAANTSDNTLANLQSSLSSLSTVSANLARNEKNDAKNAANKGNSKLSAETATQQANSNTNEKTVAQVTTPSNDSTNSADSAAANPVVGRPSGLVGVQVEQGHATEVNGQTTLHFQLVNTARNKSQSWTGRVCGVAELANATSESKGSAAVAMAARGPASGFLALPGGFKVESARAPSNGCADGELVRFSRLRPTELVIPARQDAIKRVTIFFVESGSNRTLSQYIEL